MTCNLLVLAAGRRRYVVEELFAKRPRHGILWASDVDVLTPGLTVPGVRSVQQPPGPVGDWLLGLCRDEKIDAVLSLHDYQALEVSALRGQLELLGTLWIGPSYELATDLLDKVELMKFLDGRSELAVPTYVSGDALLDCDRWVVKDRLGSGSSGLAIGYTRQQAHAALTDGQLVAQPHLDGEEWNIDFFVQSDGRIDGYSAKRKFRMRGGETDAAEVRPAEELHFDVEPLLEAFRGVDHIGNVDVDVFVQDGRMQVVDVNPRFGGGYAFSMHAGYDAANAVWDLAARRIARWPVQAVRRFSGTKSLEVVPL